MQASGRIASILRLLTGVLWVLLLAGRLPAGQINPTGDVQTFTPTKFVAGVQANAKVKIKNTGAASYFTLEAFEIPDSWTVTPRRTQKILLQNNATHTFDFSITPPDFETGGVPIKFRLYGYEFDVIEVLVDEATFTIESQTPPNAFNLESPAALATGIVQPINFQWMNSTNTLSFHFELFEEDGGFPGDLVYESTTTVANLTLTESMIRLGRGVPYFWQVTAINDVGETPNTGGPRPFTMQPAPPLGTFHFITPSQPDMQLMLDPTIEWSTSQNAVTYQLLVFRDNNGSIVEPAVLDRTLVQTSYFWDTTPLDPGVYQVAVIARNETNEKLIDGGLRTFTATPVSSFSLGSPEDGAVGLSEYPTFTWSTSFGALKYRFELFTDTGVPVGTALINFPTTNTPWRNTLSRGVTYKWRVFAIQGSFERENDGGFRRFTVIPFSDFVTLSPEHNEVGTHEVPDFVWTAASGAAGYRVEQAPSLNGLPDAGAIITSELLSAGTTQWHSQFEELTPGNTYFWRVRVQDAGSLSAYNFNGWTRFTVNDVAEFSLLSPNDGAGLPNATPTLSWNPSTNVSMYSIFLTADGLGTLPPLTTAGGITSFEFGGPVHLNGNREYSWNVLAEGAHGLRMSQQTFSFTTGPRLAATNEDVLDAILGRQVFSEQENLSVGANEFFPVDMAKYLFFTR